MRKNIIILLLLVFVAKQSHAQNNTSPYSIIGIGDLEKSSLDRTTGMGHAGLALSSNKFMYNANPASYSSLDDHFFHFEFATRFKAVSYAGKAITDPTQSQSTDLQMKKIALAIKVLPHWAVSVGLLPFSTANYSFFATKSIQGSNFTANNYYEGSGSTNQFYIANSYAVSKNLSVGVQVAYLFGQLQETENFIQTTADSTLVTTRNIFLGNLYIKYGLQYKTKLNNNWNIAFGATAANKTRLRADYHLLVKDGTTTLIDNEFYKSSYFTLPVTYTGGIAAILKQKYTFAADYNYQGWTDVNIKGAGYALVNSNRISVGMEYSKKAIFQNSQSYERYFLQAGLFYSNSYLRISGQQLNDYGVTLGAGTQLNFRNFSGIGLQGALEIGKRGTTDYGLIRENYTQFSLTVSYRDFWFTKVKKYD